jgi:hypothetical protein
LCNLEGRRSVGGGKSKWYWDTGGAGAQSGTGSSTVQKALKGQDPITNQATTTGNLPVIAAGITSGSTKTPGANTSYKH